MFIRQRSTEAETDRIGRIRHPAMAAILLVSLFACGVWLLSTTKPTDPGELIRGALASQRAGNFALAEKSALQAWNLDKSTVVALLIAVDCAERQEATNRALDLLDSGIAEQPTEVERLLLRKVILLEKHALSMDGQEASLRNLLELDPTNVEGNLRLARLLGKCGRREDAIPFAIQLLKQNLPTDLIIMLARPDGRIDAPDELDRVLANSPQDRNAIVGSASRLAEDEPNSAWSFLERIRSKADRWPPFLAIEGALLFSGHVENTDQQSLAAWASRAMQSNHESGQIWYLLGRFAERTNQREAAIRCFGTALQLTPESRRITAAYQQIAEQGDQRNANLLASHMNQLQQLDQLQNEVLFTQEAASITPYANLIDLLLLSGRIWEARGWTEFLDEKLGSPPALIPIRLRLAQLDPGSETRLSKQENNPARDLDFSGFPLPTANGQQIAEDSSSRRMDCTFTEESREHGLAFQFLYGDPSKDARRMFALTGGGIAVLDIDLDGWDDLFLNQGNDGVSDTESSRRPAELFRNLNGQRWQSIRNEAYLGEFGFGQGAAVGDLDQDGFPDLFVATIGANRVWMNQGDGTFREMPLTRESAGNAWTTSCVIADLLGDADPEIYAVNYLQGERVFERICSNQSAAPRQCSPFHFSATRDALLAVDETGEYRNIADLQMDPPPDGKGLGIEVWDTDRNGSLELLVANDTTPNFLYSRSSEQPERLEDQAGIRGLAWNGAGKAEGCMGIATGMLGTRPDPDVFITNFLSETNTFWRADPGGIYRDVTGRVGLERPSLDNLGFGTRFLDADRDGRMELFVSNGHVDDLRDEGKPYQMRPQMFQFEDGRFHELVPDSGNPYFENYHLGRAVVTFDWNHDLRTDLVVGHLDEPVALLTNSTSDRNHAIGIRLIAIKSERRAVGTRLTVRTAERTVHAQVSAGGGYLGSSSNEQILALGTADRIIELAIHWPSGRTETMRGIAADRRFTAIEGRGLFQIP